MNNEHQTQKISFYSTTKKRRTPNFEGVSSLHVGSVRVFLPVGIGMMGMWLSRSVSNFVGYAYPAYATFKVLRDNDKSKHAEWLMYWAVMSCFTAFEIFGDKFVSWLPFYYEAKIVFIFWLVLPRFKGAVTLYRKVLQPTLEKYEDDIDKQLDMVNAEAARRGGQLGSMGLEAVRRHSASLLQIGQNAIAAATTASLQQKQNEQIQKESSTGATGLKQRRRK